MVQSSSGKITPELFVERAIPALKKPKSRSKGIRVESSGLAKAFAEHYGLNANLADVLHGMRKRQEIVIFLSKVDPAINKATIYLRDDIRGQKTLDKHDADWVARDQGREPVTDRKPKPAEDDDPLAKILKG